MLEDWISKDFTTAKKRNSKPKIQLSESEKEEQKMLIRAYPRIFSRLVLFSKSLENWWRFRGSAWERHVVHSLSSLLNLEHDSSRIAGEKEFVAEISKPENYQIPKGIEFETLPESMWDAQIVEFKDLELDLFENLIVKHPGLYFAIAKFADENENETGMIFSAVLDKEEQNAVYMISREFGILCQIIACNGFEFARVWKSLDSQTSLKINQLISNSISKKCDLNFDLKEESINPLLEEIYDSGVVYDENNEPIRCIAGITGRTGRLLQWLILDYKLTKTLEIGLAYGISALHICSAHLKNGLNGSHTAIDPFQSFEWKSIGLLNIKRSGIENFRFYQQPSEYALPSLCCSGESSSFDLILIDGNHLFDYALIDLFYAFRLLKIGGFVVLDDCDTPSLIQVLQYALKNWHFLKPFKQGCFGRVFTFQKKIEQDPRPWFFSLN